MIIHEAIYAFIDLTQRVVGLLCIGLEGSCRTIVAYFGLVFIDLVAYFFSETLMQVQVVSSI